MVNRFDFKYVPNINKKNNYFLSKAIFFKLFSCFPVGGVLEKGFLINYSVDYSLQISCEYQFHKRFLLLEDT